MLLRYSYGLRYTTSRCFAFSTPERGTVTRQGREDTISGGSLDVVTQDWLVLLKLSHHDDGGEFSFSLVLGKIDVPSSRNTVVKNKTQNLWCPCRIRRFLAPCGTAACQLVVHVAVGRVVAKVWFSALDAFPGSMAGADRCTF